MPFINPNRVPRFDTMQEMMDFYYPASQEDLKKTDAPLLSSTDYWHSVVFGSKAWSQLNYEANAFAILPKKPWDRSGFRAVTAAPVASPPSGGVVENATISDSDSVKPTWAEVTLAPKTIMHHSDVSDVASFLSTVDDSVDVLSAMRQELAQDHIQNMNRMLVTDLDTLAGYNLESLDRVVSSFSEVDAGLCTAGDADIYGIDRDAAASWVDATVNHNTGTDRPLTLKLIDETLKDILVACGEKPNVILTGNDTLFEWEQLLEAERRYMPETFVVPTFNGVQAAAGLGGVEAGFMVSTYMGIPIITANNLPNESTGISRIYFLNTNYLWLKVAQPTLYDESNRVLELDRLGSRMAFRTMAELECVKFRAQGKIRDLEAA